MAQNVIYETKFKDTRIQVLEGTHNRFLMFSSPSTRNDTTQSSMNKKKPRKLQSKYSREIVKVFDHTENPKNILVLGLGGAVIPSWIHENYFDVNIDAVEIIPELKDICLKYFELPVSDRLNVIIQDANDYILTTNKKYDIIFDNLCTGAGKPEFAEIYKEWNSGLKNILNENGLLAINSFQSINTHEEYVNSLNSSFRNVIEQWHPKMDRFKRNHVVICKK